ncbi:MAG TPA: DNA alkylation repair protein [Streptosporangiaceae bacterium]
MTVPAAGWAAEAADWERALRRVGTAARAASEKAYLKSDLDFAGAGVPAIRAMVARWSKARPALHHDQVTGLVTALWTSPLYECRQAAVVLLERTSRLLGPADTGLLENLLRTSRTWALVDGLAVNVVGDIVDRWPEASDVLDRWAGDDDFWLRRSAILALLRPLRAGGGDFERFARYADAMLEEKEFFVRKAIGWVLREVAKRRPELVAAWLAPRVHRASGVTVREAVKPLPEHLRAVLLNGYRDKRPVRCDDEDRVITG